ncbi:DUF1801 domain-containing protein [Geodermatophilus ruber]|uniref:YdhG-like domain-containing protein n=1 Tax=Geodermatophilus ruber TaxID=504800 RepID=A0A1I4KJI3_9ACTN|nr:DUF1801 domain-containing protein [Geodermatophilus ruber]SFL78884.1 protein of unknown function (DU1801) [Geodermatophilus ruber]
MGRRSADADRLVQELDHPLEEGIEELRQAILDVDPDLTEQVKWKAPSFVYDGEDRVTFRLRPGDRLQLVLHRGVRTRPDGAGFSFDDPSGLIAWAAPDRGVITLADLDAVREHRDAVVSLVDRWIRV